MFSLVSHQALKSNELERTVNLKMWQRNGCKLWLYKGIDFLVSTKSS